LSSFSPTSSSPIFQYLNIQDRLSKQSKESGGAATIEVVRSMLDVLDNFDRAFQAVTAASDEEKSIEAAYQGTRDMILKVFTDLGVSEVETVGAEFDYEVHQAVMQIPSEYEEGIVCGELAKGFMLDDKLIRAAMVSVSA
jgi:molecular chaperone GrpE|tara:strand:- start:402 stop:821 length:420 start_codon:yes stop_codon:yes gene_type:complete